MKPKTYTMLNKEKYRGKGRPRREDYRKMPILTTIVSKETKHIYETK